MRMRWLAPALALVAAAAFARDEASTKKWRDDLAFFRAEMPKIHKSLFHAMTPDEFERMVASVSARVPWLEDHEIAVEIGRIVARVGDGHTHINFAQPSLGFRMLPIRLHQFSDGMFIRQSIDPSLVGAKVVRIGELDIEEAMKRMADVAPHDNEWMRRSIVALQLAVPEILHATRISLSRDRVKLRIEQNGRTRDLELTPLAMTNLPDAAANVPLYRRNADQNFWFEYLPEAKVLYVKYNAVNWSRDENGWSNPGRFFDRVFAAVDANPVEKLVIDVRNNGGGNNTLNLPIIHGLIKRDRLKVFTIIGRETFSAAQNFVNLMEKHTATMFAGEPTGGRPNHYGDPAPVRLPNSGLEIRVSTLWWQDAHPADDRAATLPHLFVEMSSADYFAGRDPVLDAVIRYRPLAELVREALPNATDVYRRFKADPTHRHLSTEAEINALGYALLREDRVDDALLVLSLNAESYPQSANAHDSLAEVLLKKGRRAEALQHLEKALQLEPRNPYRKEQLERARGG